MRNRLQVIGDKVYYDMECVAQLNELNCISSKFLKFKEELIKRFKESEEYESK